MSAHLCSLTRAFTVPTHYVGRRCRWWLIPNSYIRPRGYKTFPCSTQLSTKFILLIYVKMPTIVDILTFISMINTVSERLKAKNFFTFWYFWFLWAVEISYAENTVNQIRLLIKENSVSDQGPYCLLPRSFNWTPRGYSRRLDVISSRRDKFRILDIHNFFANQIRISEILPWDRNSYLTHAILPRQSREGYIHWLYWSSRTWSSSDVIALLKWHHHVKLHLSVFRDFWKLILNF